MIAFDRRGESDNAHEYGNQEPIGVALINSAALRNVSSNLTRDDLSIIKKVKFTGLTHTFPVGPAV